MHSIYLPTHKKLEVRGSTFEASASSLEFPTEMLLGWSFHWANIKVNEIKLCLNHLITARAWTKPGLAEGTHCQC